MIILSSGEHVSILVKNEDLIKGKKLFWVSVKTTVYNPREDFKPYKYVGSTPKRRLYDGYIKEFESLIGSAEEAFNTQYKNYTESINQAVDKQVGKPVEQAPKQEGLGSSLEQMLLKVLAEQSVDKVLEVSKPMLETHIKEKFGVLPQVHEIVLPEKKKEMQGVFHEKFDTVLKLVNASIPVFLTGATGTGKNVLCKQISEALDLEFYFSNAVTQEYKLTGFIDANGKYHETQFYQAFTKGGLFMLDEMDGSIPEVLIILNAALVNRYFDFPTGRVEAHENFRVIAAGNTYGTGADIEYSGRYQLDAASLDRFALVEIDYSPAIEQAIANGNTELLEFVQGFRQAVKKAGIKHLVMYRSLERLSKLEGVLGKKEALEISLVKHLQTDDKRIIKQALSYIVNSSNSYFKEFSQF
ncbi:MAG: AAA family ATPase [Clostridia bacterium]|nr:AAA family ATPase [Clostridia bacterium]